jgi:hypothetical protein
VENNYQSTSGYSISKVRPAVIGGAVMAATSLIPYLSLMNCACCAGIMLGGLSAVYFYLKQRPKGEPPLETKYGIILGAFAGIFGAIFETFATVIMIKFLSSEYFQGIYAELQRSIDELESSGQTVPSFLYQLEKSFESFIEEIKTSGFSFILTVFMLLFNTFKDVLFGLLGGLIGVSVLQRKSKRQQPPEVKES